jgi:subtilisin-like proprotein convertase family protein
VQRFFTINDTDTPLGSLTLSKASSNPTLVPTNNIVFAGTGTGRTVTVTPVAGQRSSTAITVTVSDGTNTASATFILTVNGPPTLTGIANQTIDEDTSTAALPFTISDVETPAGSLTLSGGSSNPTLVPTNRIVFGGSGSNRTVPVIPATNQNGSATITVSVSDGMNSVSTNFVVTVRAVNYAPTITGIPNQTIDEDTSTAALPFTISDVETPAGSLTLSGGSSDPTLVPTNRIVFGGSGANRTVTVSPATNQNGIVTITVSVSDGTNSASTNFVVTVRAVNYAPTLTGIANQTIDEDTSTPALAFTINDVETPAGSLTLSKGSSNPTLVPTNNIVLGGSGANRTVTVSPATNQNGIVTITLSVSDGTNSVSTNFVVTVRAVNDAPTISDIPDQFTPVNTATPALAFTINDVETPAGSLTLSGGSSNPSLVPTNRIVFGGSGANRTVTVSPATNQTGSVTITVTVSDGTNSTSDTFLLVVENASPTMGAIADQTVYVDQPALMVLNVGDAETAVTNLQLNLVSSNPALVSAENVVFHYFPFDGHWYLTVVPTFGLTGVATNTVTVSDGTHSASTNFVLTVNPPPAGAARFVNTNAITIPDVGAATPYPSTINVAGMSGTITNMTLTLSKINHQYIQDVHMLLVGPTGPGMVVFSRISRAAVTNITATLTDSSPFPLPGESDLWSEQFKPTDLATTNGTFTDNNFPAPAPAGPYGPVTFSNSFNGRSANGTWSLYVYDHHEPSAGTIAGGWSLMIGTTTGGVPQLRILSLTGAGTTNVVINWSAISNVTYRVQYLSDLNTTSWFDLVPDVRATNSVASAIDPLATTARRFYRIRVAP